MFSRKIKRSKLTEDRFKNSNSMIYNKYTMVNAVTARRIALDTAGVAVVDAMRGKKMNGMRYGKFVLADSLYEYALKQVISARVMKNLDQSAMTEENVSKIIGLTLAGGAINFVSTGSPKFQDSLMDSVSGVAGFWALDSFAPVPEKQ